jgi:hypothetical protein
LAIVHLKSVKKWSVVLKSNSTKPHSVDNRYLHGIR